MSDGYEVNWEILEQDVVDHWDPWGDTLDEIKASVPVAPNRDDFSYIPGAEQIYSQYMQAATALAQYVSDGSETFDKVSSMLLKTALVYATAEENSATDVARLESELDAL